MSEQQSTQPSGIEMDGFNDASGIYIGRIAIGLIFAFLSPIILSTANNTQFFFLNIEGGLEKGIPDNLKLELLYPLIAGIVLFFISGRRRSTDKAWIILISGLFPFLFFLLDENVRSSFSNLTSDFPGSGTLTFTAILAHLGVFGILAGVHASRVNPRLHLPGLVAVIGAILYFLSILKPINGAFSFVDILKNMFAPDFSRVGLNFVSGLQSLVIMVLMVKISVKCFKMFNDINNREKIARGILKLFIILFIVICMYLVYLLVVIAIKQHGGSVLLANLTLLIKLVPWILGLYLLIPLGISEFLLLGKAEPKLT